MAYWVYKCNRRKTSYSTDSGDWGRVFDPPWKALPWGSIDRHPDLADVANGDLLLCQQSDVQKKLLVGIARVLGKRDDKLLITPIEAIGTLIRPLKEADRKIATIAALRGGQIKTVYPIRDLDAKRLLRAARAQASINGTAKSISAKWTSVDETSFRRTRDALKELPAKERRFAIVEVRRVIRSALLRRSVLAHWPARCAACGCQIEMDGFQECEVAHIRDVHKFGGDQIRNAVPLCRTHHWAFDRLLWAIRPKDHQIIVRRSLRKNPSLSAIHGRKVAAPPSPKVDLLASDVVTWRWQQFATAASKDL